MAKEREIADLLRPVIQEAGLYLEYVRVVRAGKRTMVRVIVDLPEGPGGITPDRLTEVSRAISAVMDQEDPIAGAYTLEVSTPGVDRALREPRHFSRAQGRKVAITLRSGQSLIGEVLEAASDSVSIADEHGTQMVAYEDISAASVVVEF
ncbi:ribosome maturation factor RimP [Trueperella sp. LYQ143]|uniref:ribosome maturation factor RimP n=1 Tax=unclassified Trueperella TaxID=2630174 RepID=UPI003983CB26